MIKLFIRAMGVAPGYAGKTGKREAAWTLVLIAAVFTFVAMFIGPEMVRAATAVLVILWPSAILAVCGAYKLEHDKGNWQPQQPELE